MAKELQVGEQAPEFTLPTGTGTPVSLKSLTGKQVVLYFYPKDDTPGCTREACGFRDSMKALDKAGAVVLGVSMDDADSHRQFIDKYGLPFPLLCDTNGSAAKAYGVYKKKNMYGKIHWGIERSTFVIDEAGTLKAIFRRVKVDGHVDEVLATLRG
jgi:peroxiredoxin Q/BCP